MTGFAVLDLETTGLRYRTDRIVEVGIVHLDSDLQETGRWSTLVNPQRAITAGEIHGIAATDVAHAPTLAEAAEDVIALLADRVLVAHNAVFDVNHLMLGLARAGVAVPTALPAVADTMRYSDRMLGARSLGHACDVLSIDIVDAHAALADAVAASEVLRRLFDISPGGLEGAVARYAVSPETGCWRSAPFAFTGGGDPLAALLKAGTSVSWPGAGSSSTGPRSGYTRAHATEDRRRDEGYLAGLVARLPMVDDDPNSDATAYLTLLDEALEDRLITTAEAEALVLAAQQLGLSQAEVAAANQQYLAAVASAAWADGIVSDAERADLEAVARLLGLDEAAASAALDQARDRGQKRTATAERIGARPGDRVAFTGDMSRPRALLEHQAITARLVPTGTISRRTAMLVIADPHSQSGKARKARDLGVRLVSEPVFDEICRDLG